MESIECGCGTSSGLTAKEERLDASHHAGVPHHGRGGLAREAGLAPGVPVDGEAVEVVEEEGAVVALGVPVDTAEHKHVLPRQHGAVPAAGAGKSTGNGRGVPPAETRKVQHKERARRLIVLDAVPAVDVDFHVLCCYKRVFLFVCLFVCLQLELMCDTTSGEVTFRTP